jgi:peptide deformylase
MPSTASPTYPSLPVLVHYPDPVLRRVAEPVTVFDDGLRQFCSRMFACMEVNRGIGLAAPQVSVSRRIFVTDHARRNDQGSDRRVWINPRLENCSGESVYEEGCLSFPGIYARVTRHNRFDVVYQDEWGSERRLTLDIGNGDFLGIVVQHEFDHLDGKVFVDHLSPLQIDLIRKRLTDMEREYKRANGKAGMVIRR